MPIVRNTNQLPNMMPTNSMMTSTTSVKQTKKPATNKRFQGYQTAIFLHDLPIWSTHFFVYTVFSNMFYYFIKKAIVRICILVMYEQTRLHILMVSRAASTNTCHLCCLWDHRGKRGCEKRETLIKFTVFRFSLKRKRDWHIKQYIILQCCIS